MPELTSAIDSVGIADGYTPAVPYEQSDYDHNLVGQIEDLLHDAERQKLPYEEQWEQYRNFLKGNQLLYRDRDTRALVRVVDLDNKRLYSLNNKLRPVFRSFVGKWTKIPMEFEILPANGDQDQIAAARAGEAFFKSWHRSAKFVKKYIKMVRHMGWSGMGVAHLYWNPLAGRELMICEACGFESDIITEGGEPCPSCIESRKVQEDFQEQLGQGVATGQIDLEQGAQASLDDPPIEQGTLTRINEGDADLEVIDPRDIYFDPGVEEAEDLRYVIVKRPFPVTTLREKFPEMARFIHAEDGLYADRTARITYSVAAGTWGSEFLQDHAYLIEYHEKPTTLYPNGRKVSICNNRILDERPTEYWRFGRLPFFWLFWDKNPGEFIPESWISNAWHRQKELNEVETQQREHSELMARTKVLIPQGTQLPTDEISAVTAQTIKYNPAITGHKPEYMMPPPEPPSLETRKQALVADIQEQAAVSNPEMGISPTDPNGRAMAIIEAEADQQMGPAVQIMREEFQDLHRCLLILIQKYYSPDRKFSIRGDDALEVYSFQDINLSPGWSIEMTVSDGLSSNKALRKQEVIELANLGVYTDPMTGAPDPKKVAKAIGIKIPGLGLDPNSTEHSAAQAMLRMVEDGQQPQPQMFDDPIIFSEVLRSWLRTRGRQSKDPNAMQYITLLYAYYAQWVVMMQEEEGGGMPPPFEGAQNQPGQTTPGGSAAGPGGMGSDIRSNASARINEADNAAEQNARTQTGHEG